MAIFNPGAEEQPSEPTKEPVEVNNGYQSATVDTKKQPLQTLLTNIEGYSWTVDYYSQILAHDDGPQPQSLTLDPSLQQYHHVKDFEIRVNNPLTYEYTKDRQSNYLEGGGYIYPGGLVPSRGDMFVADVGNGRNGIFTLLDVTPMSYMLEKCYEVTYRLTDLCTDEKMDDLGQKTVKVSYFVKDFLMHGQNPVLSGNTVSLKKQLDGHGYSLLDHFLSDFAVNEQRFLLVPDQERTTYDHFVNQLLMSFLNTSQNEKMRLLNYPSLKEVPAMQVTTLWDLLISQQPVNTKAMGSRLEKRMTITNTWTIKNTPNFGSLYYSSIQRLVWPFGASESVSTHSLITGDETYLEAPYVDPEVSEEQQRYIFPVNVDDHYVLSQAFYDGDRENQSQLEHLTTQMLAREKISEQRLVELCDRAYGWQPIERFYYMPILLVLIQYAVRSL
jgi:hypothetical protein